jgi:hypothetical protein
MHLGYSEDVTSHERFKEKVVLEPGVASKASLEPSFTVTSAHFKGDEGYSVFARAEH